MKVGFAPEGDLFFSCIAHMAAVLQPTCLPAFALVVLHLTSGPQTQTAPRGSPGLLHVDLTQSGVPSAKASASRREDDYLLL